MLSPRWRKVLRDLAEHKLRTALVVLSIAVGVFAVGMLRGAYAILSHDIAARYAAIDSAQATLYTSGFDHTLIDAVRRMPGVADAGGRRTLTVRFKAGADATDPSARWRTLTLVAVPDFRDIHLDKIWPVSGAWPPTELGVLLERASIGWSRSHTGGTLLVQLADGSERTLHVDGVVHDLQRAPSFFTNQAYGYVTLATLERLGQPHNLNQLTLAVVGPATVEHIRALATDVKQRLERSGRPVSGMRIPKPGEGWASPYLLPIFLLMGALGALTLLASGFLIVNTLSALLAQHIRQIGIMKAIGARSRQVMGMYFSLVAAFGIMALAVAIPLGALAAHGFAAYLAGLLNIDLLSRGVPMSVVALQIVIGLVVPLAAALYPVIAGSRVTVREAISGYGLAGATKPGLIDRAVQRIRGLSRPLLLSLRNTFRRKGRLALTLSTLTLGGAIFVSVLSVQASLGATLDAALSYWNYDVEIQFDHAYRTGKITDALAGAPGVAAAESWAFGSAQRVYADDHKGNSFSIVAPPAQTTMLKPILLAGRWLVAADQSALVINSELLKDEPDLHIGDWITLEIGGKKSRWRIVGLVKGELTGAIGYANYPYFSRLTGEVGRASSVQIQTAQHDAASQAKIAQALEHRFTQDGMRVTRTTTTGSIRRGINSEFNILVTLLLVMAILLAVVGGLGLMGTMSINVLERIREIGVMRAIGASNRSVRRIVVVEGVMIGMISWVLGTLCAMPIGRLLSSAVGSAFMHAPLSYRFAVRGALLWCLLVLALAAAASVLPAWNASRVTVRDVLNYE